MWPPFSWEVVNQREREPVETNPVSNTLPYCNEASEERRAIQEFVKKWKRKEGAQWTVFGFASLDGPESIITILRKDGRKE